MSRKHHVGLDTDSSENTKGKTETRREEPELPGGRMRGRRPAEGAVSIHQRRLREGDSILFNEPRKLTVLVFNIQCLAR